MVLLCGGVHWLASYLQAILAGVSHAKCTSNGCRLQFADSCANCVEPECVMDGEFFNRDENPPGGGGDCRAHDKSRDGAFLPW